MNPSDTLLAALDDVVANQLGMQLTAATQRLSSRYRDRGAEESSPFLHDETDVLAYAAFRAPATFASLRAVFEEVRARRPAPGPETLLDVGAGPGTTLWAADGVWPELREAVLIERNPAMIRLGARLAGHGASPLIRDARWMQGFAPLPEADRRFDVVTAGYMMGEMAEVERGALLEWLWSVTEQVLVIVEPGTPRGFALVRACRAWLLDQGARMIAPCPHADGCPMSGGDWCHFSTRLQRSEIHRRAKHAVLPYEDEKYSYVVVSREAGGSAIAGRVVRHPQVRPGHIYLEVCAPGGLERRIVTRKDRAAFRRARDVRWGDALVDLERTDG